MRNLLRSPGNGHRHGIHFLQGMVEIGVVQSDHRLGSGRRVAGVERRIPLPILVSEDENSKAKVVTSLDRGIGLAPDTTPARSYTQNITSDRTCELCTD